MVSPCLGQGFLQSALHVILVRLRGIILDVVSDFSWLQRKLQFKVFYTLLKLFVRDWLPLAVGAHQDVVAALSFLLAATFFLELLISLKERFHYFFSD